MGNRNSAEKKQDVNYIDLVREEQYKMREATRNENRKIQEQEEQERQILFYGKSLNWVSRRKQNG